ncbi:hypothetical protein EUGRSUZ_A00157 [Eucalyptus grandis]|uniref:Uncharacterized protein n=2 Tax=Eucalyptus grandis TaxID=71139 RepID=A0ACC3LZM4_EUCGR|nr:hypothetical protein EUGRSUZ_A00157 [Eucalyptus grandis]
MLENDGEASRQSSLFPTNDTNVDIIKKLKCATIECARPMSSSSDWPTGQGSGIHGHGGNSVCADESRFATYHAFRCARIICMHSSLLVRAVGTVRIFK